MASSSGRTLTNDQEVRIVMVGKTGSGKSATGNTILGRDCFESKFSAKSMTVDCSKCSTVVDGEHITVIDTPGLFDTRFGKEKTTKDLSQCITYASPGPHIFLVVVALGRFTDEEKQTVEKIQEKFGQAADRYSMVLFTRGDDIRGVTIEEFLAESPELQELVRRCNGQYHVFNNNLQDKKPQVTELLQKIREIVQKNGGSHYTNQMFQEAERKIEEEKQRILKEKEEKIRREKEKMEKEMQEKFQKKMQKMTEQLEAERERERKEREREKREREKEREEMNEERRREREAREAEKEREREEREKERRALITQMKEEHERQVEAERDRMQAMYDKQARREAEDRNPLVRLVESAVEVIVGLFKPKKEGKTFGET